MTLIGIIGTMGTGKTLALTWLAYHQYNKFKRTVYSNYHLTQIPYIPISSKIDVKDMVDGFVALDELWFWADSRKSTSHQNRFINGILLKSRKRMLEIGYTTQSLNQIDKRIRDNTNYLVVPEGHKFVWNEKVKDFSPTILSLTWYSRASGLNQYQKTMWLKTSKIFTWFDTAEEIGGLENE